MRVTAAGQYGRVGTRVGQRHRGYTQMAILRPDDQLHREVATLLWALVAVRVPTNELANESISWPTHKFDLLVEI